MGLDDFDSNEMINKVTGVLSGMVVLSGVAMVVGGIVVLAIDCPSPNHPWVLLVWGLVTIMLYGHVVTAAHDRMRSARENIAPNPLVQGLKHLASLDGASAWWFAKVLIENFTDSSGMGCTDDAIMAGFVLCVITLTIRFHIPYQCAVQIYHVFCITTLSTMYLIPLYSQTIKDLNIPSVSSFA